VPVYGPDARKSSRSTIDEAGFRGALERIARSNSYAAARGVLDIRCTGAGNVAGRPTWIIERFLPYEGPCGAYPDAHLIMHLDCEWLLPLAIFSYADAGDNELLGSYVFTDVDLQPQFDESDFAF
jgi:hypothetical protein